MTTPNTSFDHLSDQDLLREVTRLAAREREATVGLIASLAELDRRRLYLAEGSGSLFVYCTHVLRLSESATYKRIAAARAAQQFPVILERLAAGDVTLTTIRLLAPHLTEANHVALLDEVRLCSTREVEQVVARLQPRPDVASTVRRLPTLRTAPAPAAHALASSAQPEPPPGPAAPHEEASCPPASDTGPAETHREPRHAQPPGEPHRTVTPLAPSRYKVSFTISAETYAKLREVQDLLRHVQRDGDVAVLFDRGLTLLLREAAKTKRAATDQPRTGGTGSAAPKPGSRHIPAEVKRRVWARDGGQCAFVSASGHRCPERGFLEYHHCVPYAAGGAASVENISLRCRHHNAHEAEQLFGPWQPSSVREERPRYGTDGLTAREGSARVQGRHVFAGRDAAGPHAGRTATGRAASSWGSRRRPSWPWDASQRSAVRAP